MSTIANFKLKTLIETAQIAARTPGHPPVQISTEFAVEMAEELLDARVVMARIHPGCINTGNYGALKLRPGECKCAMCLVKDYKKKWGL